jgi:hypothetical protein
MRDQRLEIRDIVKHIDDATLGKLDVPEFQRKFVWTAEKVKKFVDSLWRGYPVGAFLLWESTYSSPKTALGTQDQKHWIVDGQQRITALSLLFGRKPYWWQDAAEWNKYSKRYDVLVNVDLPDDALEFGLPNPVRKKATEWVSVRTVLNESNLSRMAQELAENLGAQKFASVHERLQSIRKIENFPIFEIIIDHELEDVAEIFSRLNTAGTKIKESDVIIALVASKQEGWVREQFDEFLKDLSDRGFVLDPSVLIRTLAAVGKGAARLRDIPGRFWEASKEFDEAWKKTKGAVTFVLKSLSSSGILSSELLPAHNALIPLFTLQATFPKEFNSKKGLHWFLVAIRDGRYSGSAITTLDQDIKLLKSAPGFEEAVDRLEKQLRATDVFTSEDFQADYSDDFLRLVLYLSVFHRRAMDWLHQDVRIGFDRSDNQLNDGFRPEWHHFFPKKVLRGIINEGKMHKLANIVVLNEKANRAFWSKDPKDYLKEFEVRRERLLEQMVPPDAGWLEVGKYDEFIENRASRLAEGANELMSYLKAG